MSEPIKSPTRHEVVKVVTALRRERDKFIEECRVAPGVLTYSKVRIARRLNWAALNLERAAGLRGWRLPL